MAETLAVTSRSTDSAEAMFRRFFPAGRLHHLDAEDFFLDWTSTRSEGMTVLSYRMHTDMDSSLDEPEQIVITDVTADRADVTVSGETVPAGRPFLLSGPGRSRWSGDMTILALVYDRAAAQRWARQDTGRDDLVLAAAGTLPVSLELERYWRAALSFVHSTLRTVPDLGPLVEAQLRRTALHATLHASPTTYLAAMDASLRLPASPAAVRRAKQYMTDNAHLPITVDDVAVAAGLPTRTLQEAFRAATGMSPMRYLRRTRLDGAHRDLMSADPSLEAVGEIGRRWGFAHPGRFAQYYRETYGQHPGETLRA